MNYVGMKLGLAALLICSGCTQPTTLNTAEKQTSQAQTVVTSLEQIDMAKWQYNEEDNVYYQIGIAYCSDPADEEVETLAVFVPGDYMKAQDNGDGTYTCTLNEEASIHGYTATSAPIVMPINTPGYSAQAALTDYTDVSEYTDQGMVYVHAGCRGRESGAPAGVTDLKAAIRYLRYSDQTLAGDSEKIFVFGMSGGGAQSAVVAASGDSELYDTYLEDIGAVQGVSDAVYGSMDWCPITSLDTADAAYEWMMGSTRSDLSEDIQAISDALAQSYIDSINAYQFKDEDGNVLTLNEDGISGSYYDYVKEAIETSLNEFLANTQFPYTEAAQTMGAMPGQMPEGQQPSGPMPSTNDAQAMDGIQRSETQDTQQESTTYESAQDYINSLNANGQWITYDEQTNTASISSVEDFVSHCKQASKSLGAFDQLDEGQGENQLFAVDGSGGHFDETLASVLSELDNEYAQDYKDDLAQTDWAGNDVQTRVNMYSPLYYLSASSQGYQTSTVAKYWRIRTGIEQGDTSLTTELNLALALENYDEVKDVDFATIWGQGHTQAEQTGDATSNFIEWIHTRMSEN